MAAECADFVHWDMQQLPLVCHNHKQACMHASHMHAFLTFTAVGNAGTRLAVVKSSSTTNSTNFGCCCGSCKYGCCCDGTVLSSNVRSTPINRCMAADMQHKYARTAHSIGFLRAATAARPPTNYNMVQKAAPRRSVLITLIAQRLYAIKAAHKLQNSQLCAYAHLWPSWRPDQVSQVLMRQPAAAAAAALHAAAHTSWLLATGAWVVT